MAKASPTTHTIKITLRHVEPPVWRRLTVRSDTGLSDLAEALGTMMGWFGHHLHMFEADGVQYGPPDPDGDDDELDERRYQLGDVASTVGSRMRFDYDFGDGWEHDLVVEAIGALEDGVTYPRLLAGERACPPEDCGGPQGYQRLLEALADPEHPDHDDMTEWIGEAFDPERFEVPAS